MRVPGFLGYKRAPFHDKLPSVVILIDLPPTLGNTREFVTIKTYASVPVTTLGKGSF